MSIVEVYNFMNADHRKEFFFKMIKENKIEMITSLLNEGKADVNAKDVDGWTPLHAASYYGHNEIVLFLLNEGKADVNAKTVCGWTALHEAAYYGHIKIVLFLLNEGKADVNAKDVSGWTPLHQASYDGKNETVILLIEQGKADSTIKTTKGETAYDLAVNNKKEKVVEYLKSLEVKPSTLTVDILTTEETIQFLDEKAKNNLLCKMVMIGNLKMIQLLLDNGANINYNGGIYESLLHIASEWGQVKTLEYLIERMDVNIADSKGNTALHIMSRYSDNIDIEIMHTLINNKANVNAENIRGRTPLHKAAASDSYNIELLIKNGANVNAADNFLNTPLHIAVYNSNLDIVKMLVENGADIYTINSNNKTARDIACNQEVIDYLYSLSVVFG